MALFEVTEGKWIYTDESHPGRAMRIKTVWRGFARTPAFVTYAALDRIIIADEIGKSYSDFLATIAVAQDIICRDELWR